jgi:hypothetical protein
MNTRVRRFAMRWEGLWCALLVAAGCAAKSPVVQSEEAWSLTGSRIIACCCHTPCPCRVNYKPTHCHGCDFTTAVRIERGHIGGVSMDGMMWIITGRVFGEEPAENWSYIYISDRASDEQYQALTAFLTEGAAGLGERAEHLVGRSLGMRKVPIRWSVSSDGRQWTARAGDVLRVRTQSIILPGRRQPVTSTGIFDDFGDRFIHADCLEHTYNDPAIGYKWNLAGRQSNQARFAIVSTRGSGETLGWGCWSAHAALGDRNRSQYQERLIGHD